MKETLSDFDHQVAAALNAKTKPVGSLGRVEQLAAQIARVQGTLTPQVETCHLTIFAGDHGMAQAGVSAYPQAVTRQMALNFLSGGAAANVFAKSVGARLQVVDAGVTGEPIEHPDLLDHRVASGTQNAIEAAAMTSDQLEQALNTGHALGAAIKEDVACFGEMGIGNTSSATLLASKLLPKPIAELTGRGTGLDDDGVARKQVLLEHAAT